MRNAFHNPVAESKSKSFTRSDGNDTKSLLDFFKIDIMRLPDDRFIEGVAQFNSLGDSIKHYHADLEYPEFDIFDTVRIIRFQDGIKNIFFKYYNLSKLKVEKLKKLIDSLYLLYGEDDGHKGKFSENDLKDYNSESSDELFGRRWIRKNQKYPVAVEINKLANVITLSIWGIGGK